MSVRILAAGFDPWTCLADYQRTRSGAPPGQFGATAVFVGTMRDFNQGDAVQRLFLEHYPGMTESHLDKIAAEANVTPDNPDERPDRSAMLIVLTYLGASNVGASYTCANDGLGTGHGCNAAGGYLNYLAADDDNGDLNDGTPHMTALHAAFSRHNIG